jgi:hypothetical protein
VDVLIDTEEKGVPIWDSSDGLITIIGKRNHRPDPAHRIIFGHASHCWLRFRAENNRGLAGIPSSGKACGSMPMGQVDSFASRGPDLDESLNIGQQEVLERAVGKMVLLGKQVGVSPDEMIQLLESGLTVVDLLEYLGIRNGQRS